MVVAALQVLRTRAPRGPSPLLRRSVELPSRGFSNPRPTLALSQLLMVKPREAHRAKRGGEGGIRTPGTVTRTTDFESVPFDHSGTSPSRKRHQRERSLQRKIQSKDSERTSLIGPTTYQTDSSSNLACSIQDRYFSQNSATSSRIT